VPKDEVRKRGKRRGHDSIVKIVEKLGATIVITLGNHATHARAIGCC
jgi:hypothetical protein